MANILGSLFVDLKANTADFVSGMSAASYAAKRAGQDIQTSFSRLGSAASEALAPFGELGRQIGATLSQVGGAAGRAMTSFGQMGGALGATAAVGAGAATALVAVAGSALALATHSAEGASKLYALSQSTGVSTEALSAFQFVARETDVDVESMTRGLERMSKSAFAAATAPAGTVNAYTRLGVAVRNADGSFRPVQAVFSDLAARFAAMPDGIAKSALAMQIFGRSGADLIPVLNEGRAGIEDLLAQASALGVVLDHDTARAAEEVHRQLTALSAAGDGLMLELMRQLLPALNTVGTALVNALKSPSGLRDLIDGVAWLTKVFLGVGQTIYSVLKQVGVFVGNSIACFSDLASFIGKVFAEAAKGVAGDWGSVVAMWHDTHARMKAEDKALADDGKKIWDDNAKFITGLWSKPTLRPERAPKPGAVPDLTPKATPAASAALDQANKMVAALRAQTDAQLALAAATSQTVAAQRLQEAAGEANELVARLQATAANLQADAARATGAQHTKLLAEYTALVALIRQETAEIQANTAVKLVAKDAVSLVSGELEKETTANDNQVASLSRLAAAYRSGLGAVASAEIDKSLEAETEKVAVLGEELDRLSGLQGVNAAALTTLRAALDQANAALTAHRAQLAAIRSLAYDVDINKAAAALAGERPYVEAINRAQLQSADAIRAATAALEAYRWLEEHPGATPDQVAAMTAQYRALAEQQDAAQISQEAAHYSLARIQEEEVTRLEEVRAALRAAGQSTLLVDAQIRDAQNQLAAQWDRAAIQVGTLHQKTIAFFDELRLEGTDLGAKVFGSLLKAVDDIETQFVRLVVTGKANFKQLFQGLEEQIIKAGMQRAVGQVAAKIGIKIPGAGGQLGDSPSNPLYVKDVSGGGLGGGAIGGGGGGEEGGGEGEGEGEGDGGILGGLWSKLSGAFGSITSTIGGLVSKLAAGLSSVFGKLGGLFGGGMQHGGNVTPGRFYLVGERHPEFFVPRQAGQIRTALEIGQPHQTVVNFHVNGVQDFDSFRRSNSQVMALLQNQLAVAYGRNR